VDVQHLHLFIIDILFPPQALSHGPGALVDVQHLHLLGGSDHCPLLLTIDARAAAAALA